MASFIHDPNQWRGYLFCGFAVSSWTIRWWNSPAMRPMAEICRCHWRTFVSGRSGELSQKRHDLHSPDTEQGKAEVTYSHTTTPLIGQIISISMTFPPLENNHIDVVFRHRWSFRFMGWAGKEVGSVLVIITRRVRELSELSSNFDSYNYSY